MRRVAPRWTAALVIALLFAGFGILARDFGSFLEGALLVGFAAVWLVVPMERARRRCELYRQALLLDASVPGLHKHLIDCMSCAALASRLQHVDPLGAPGKVPEL